jgi:phosphoglycerate dehydrogenase-like enzyme
MARHRVVVALTLAPPLLDQLRDYDLTMVAPADAGAGRFGDALHQAEGILVNSHVPVDSRIIDAAPELKVISTMSVGLDHIDKEAAWHRGITITNTPVLSAAVADLTVALMTMLSRRLPQAMRAVAEGEWHVPLGGDLAGKMLLLVGFGRIGQAVSKRALAAEMQVTYFDTRHGSATVPGVAAADTLAGALPAADFVSLHVDLNPATHRLMGASQFALMKPTAFLVNTSRGGVVDQVALTRAVTEGAIAGAGLDVLETEPPLPDDPLVHHPNVIIVPHIGSATTETRGAMARCAVDNLVMVLRRQGKPFVVPPAQA